MAMQKIVTNLWFDGRIEEALEFYTSLLPDSRVLDIVYYTEAGPGNPTKSCSPTLSWRGRCTRS